MPTNPPLPATVEVVIEVPRGSFVKRDAHGHIDLLSPVPAPFNYGRVTGVVGGDGESQDAVVLGPRLPRGHTLRLQVQGVVRFVDRGQRDDKLVCGQGAPSRLQKHGVVGFFRIYAHIKRMRDRLSRRRPDSAFEGWHPLPATPAT